MKKTMLTIATLAVATLGWIATAAAQGPDGGHMRRPGGPGGPGFGPGGPGGPPIEMIAEHLGLNDDQKTQWKAIHQKARETGEPLMKAAGEAKEAFDKALEGENADPTAVGQAAIAMRNARKKIDAHHQATLDSVKAILTPEQLAKFEEMGKHRSGGPGMGKPRGPGRTK
ncbi:MAG: Spy/CpxP family protein refolding chaperone [Vicinamibacteria bacterium]